MNFKLETIYVISKLIDIIEYCEFDLVTYSHFNDVLVLSYNLNILFMLKNF